MSNQTEWQKWCEETAPVMAAAGRGEVVQVMPINREWSDKKPSTSFHHSCKYRIKPRTIRIGEYDVPDPMREAPEVGAVVFTASLTDPYFYMAWQYDGSDLAKGHIDSGIAHSEKSSAIVHARALISLTAKKD